MTIRVCGHIPVILIFFLSACRVYAGQLKFEGVPVDITTADNEDLVIAPGSGGKTRIGIASVNDNYAVSQNDLFVSGILETGGAGYFDTTLTVTGALTANGNVILGDGSSDKISATGRLASDLLPDVDSSYNLGSSILAFSGVYAGRISSSGSALILSPASGYPLIGNVVNNAASGDETAYDLALTVDKSGSGNYCGLKLDVTETLAPGSANKLLDLQVSGNSHMRVYSGMNSDDYGLLSLGTGYWDGSSSGHFAGSADGTILAVNTPSGFAGNFIDLQSGGESKFAVDYAGNIVSSGSQIYSGDMAVGGDLSVNGVVQIDTGLITCKIYPAVDSATAVQVNKADGMTNVVNIDTIDGRVGIGTTNPSYTLQAVSSGDAVPSVGVYGYSSGQTADLLQVGKNVGATPSFVIDSGGRVGIGTTAPSSPLTINASSTDPQFRITRSSRPTQGMTITAGAGTTKFTSVEGTDSVYGQYQFDSTKGASTVTRMYINSAGNVGIGTTSPAYTLDVSGDIRATGTIYGASGTQVPVGTGTENHLPKWSASGTLGDSVLYDDGAKVGIGTTGPSFPLSFGTALGNKIALYDSGSGNGYGFGIQASLLQVFSTVSDTDITFGYGNSSSMTRNVTFKGNGNVGIGTMEPGTKLHVYDDNTAVLKIEGGTTSTPARRAILDLKGNQARAAGILFENAYNPWFFGTPYLGGDTLQIGKHATQPEYPANAFVAISSTGNIGIGTTSPAYKLDVRAVTEPVVATLSTTANDPSSGRIIFGVATGATMNEGGIFRYDGSANQILLGSNISDGIIKYHRDASTETLMISSVGNVGIGTTSPAYKLDVSGDIRATGTIYGASGTQVPVGTGTENYLSKWSASGTLGDSVVYENSGNVGIGTTTPTTPLYVVGDIRSSGSVWSDTNLRTNGIMPQSNGTTLILSTLSNGNINFAPNGTGNSYFSNGNVGIGTTAPSGKLHVSYPGFNPLILERNDDSAFAQGLEFRKGRNGLGIQVGDQLFRMMAFGELNDGTYASASNHQDFMTAEATDNFTSVAQGRQSSFYVVPTGSIAQTLALRLLNNGNVYMPGNVGIGTTEPGDRLELATGVNPGLLITGNSTTAAESGSISFASNADHTDTRIRLVNDEAENILRFDVRNTKASAWTPAMSIIRYTSGLGNVGIGTTTPAYKLDVSGDIRATGTIYGASGTQVPVGTGTENYLSKWSASGTLGDSVLYDDGTNVGIGTTTPLSKLSVGDVGSANYVISGIGNNGGIYGNAPNYGVYGLATTGQGIRGEATSGIGGYFKSSSGYGLIVENGNVGIGTTTPGYELDVNGVIRAQTAIITGMNVETLSANKILTPGSDKMYQYLDPNGVSRNITLATATAVTGDRFIVRNNAVSYNSSYYLAIYQSTTLLDYVYVGSTREYVFDGVNWISGSNGSGGYDNIKRNIALGYNAIAYGSGTALGYNAQGYTSGAAVGDNSYGYNYGAALGSGSKGIRYGVAIGYQAGKTQTTLFDLYNVLVGAYAGYQLTGNSGVGLGNIMVGYQAGYDATYSPTTGSKNILIGYQAGAPSNTTSNFLNIGNAIFATGINNSTFPAISEANVGIGITTPNAPLHVTAAKTNNILARFEDTSALSTGELTGIRMQGKNSIGDSQYLDWFFEPNTGKYGFGYGTGTTNLPISAGLSYADLTVDNQGNVGIGTASPAYKLDVSGDIRATGTIYGASGTQVPVGTGTENYLSKWSASGTLGDSVLYDDGANVGIGTTTPEVDLHVVGNIYASNSLGVSNNGLHFVTTATGGWLGNIKGISGNGIAFGQGTSEAMRIDSSGNVGIGTTTPNEKLKVNGNIQAIYGKFGTVNVPPAPNNPFIIASDSSDRSRIFLSNTNTGDAQMSFATDTSTQWSVGWQRASGNMVIADHYDLGASPRMVINSSGNVGIGTTSPAYNLDVSGDIRATGTIYGASGTQVPVGIGTENYLSKWSASGTLGDSVLYDDGTNVGIGTMSPSTLLEIAQGDIADMSKGLSITKTGQNWRFHINTDNALNIRDVTGTTNKITIGNTVNGNVLFNTGNVGIGTTSPESKLDVLGDFTLTAVKTGNAARYIRMRNGNNISLLQFEFPEATNIQSDIRFFRETNNLTPPQLVIFKADGTNSPQTSFSARENSFINAISGNVGIGTTNSGSRLVVQGTTTDNTASGLNVIDSSGASVLFVRNDGRVGIGTETPSLSLTIDKSSNPAIAVSVSGSIRGTLAAATASEAYSTFATTGDVIIRSSNEDLILTTKNSSGAIRFGAGNPDTEKVTILNSGNVGIGTTSPAYTLDVSGDIRATGTIYGASGTQVPVGTGTENYLSKWSASGTLGDSVLYDDGTNVGIGTTTPGAALHVAIASAVDWIRLERTGTRTWGLNSSNGHLNFYDETASTLPLVVEGGAPSYSMYVKNSGNVGIGTTTPEGLLHLVKDDNFDVVLQHAETSTPGTRFIFKRSRGTIASPGNVGSTDILGEILVQAYSGGFDDTAAIRFESDGISSTVIPTRITFKTSPNNAAGQERMRIDSAGNVGIGTTSPAYNLDVSGDIRATGTIYGASGTQVPVGTGTENYLSKWSASGTLGDSVLYDDGTNVGIGTTSPAYPLDVQGNTRITGTLYNTANNSSNYSKAGYFTAYGNDLDAILRANGTGNIVFQDSSSSPLVTVKGDSGSVGIGTISPNAVLDILDTTISHVRLSYDSSHYSTIGVDSNGYAYFGGTSGRFYFNASNKNNVFYVYDYTDGASSYATYNGSGYTLRKQGNTTVSIPNNGDAYFNQGNVGIGTAAPSRKLHVYSAELVSAIFERNLSADVGIQLKNPDFNWVFGFDDSQETFSIAEASDLNSGSQHFVIKSGGNVGIGTTSPAYKLDVSGDIRATGTIYGASGTQVPVGTGTENYLSKWSASGTLGDSVLYDDGTNVGIGTTSPGYPLDVVGIIRTSGSVIASNTTLSGNGSAGYPAHSFNGDQDSGMFAAAANILGFSVGGVEKLRIDSTGNVGIGTTAPTFPLSFGTALGNKIALYDSGSGNGYGFGIQASLLQVFSTASDTDITFGYGNSSSMTRNVTFKGNGNVGIGTTAPSNALDVIGSISASGSVTAGTAILNGSTGIYLGSSGRGRYGFAPITPLGAYPLTLYSGNSTYTDGYINFNVAGSERVRIDSSGNIGIGTTSPAYALDVSGDIRATGTIYGASGTQVPVGTGTENYLSKWSASGTLGDSVLYDDGTNVGIGTTTPGAKLEVAHGVANFRVEDLGTYSTKLTSSGGLGLNANGGGSLVFLIADTEKARIDTAGNVGIGTTAPASKAHIWVNGTDNALTLHRNTTIAGDTVALNFGLTTGADPSANLFGAVKGVRVGGLALYDGGDTGTLQETMRLYKGNVGIGTASPEYKLDISGNSRVTGYNIVPGGNYGNAGSGVADVPIWVIGETHNNWGIFYNEGSPDRIEFKSYGTVTSAIALDTGSSYFNAGNVGIGTTAPGTQLEVMSASGGILRLKRDDSIVSGGELLGELQFYSNDNNLNAEGVRAKISAFNKESDSDGIKTNLVFYTVNGVADNLAEAMRIDESGNVGIGTTSPVNKLNISGANASSSVGDLSLIGITNTDTTNNNTIGFGFSQANASGTIQTVAGIDLVGVSHADGAQSGALAFATRNAGSWGERLRIDPSGNVGIGIDSPSYVLDVQHASSKINSKNGYLTNGADYAEYFENEEIIPQGALVGMNMATGKVHKYTAGDEFIGIVSNGGGFVGNGNKDIEKDSNYTLVGLLGQLDFVKEETIIENRIVYTKDRKRIGILLSNDKVLLR